MENKVLFEASIKGTKKKPWGSKFYEMELGMLTIPDIMDIVTTLCASYVKKDDVRAFNEENGYGFVDIEVKGGTIKFEAGDNKEAHWDEITLSYTRIGTVYDKTTIQESVRDFAVSPENLF